MFEILRMRFFHNCHRCPYSNRKHYTIVYKIATNEWITSEHWINFDWIICCHPLFILLSKFASFLFLAIFILPPDRGNRCSLVAFLRLSSSDISLLKSNSLKVLYNYIFTSICSTKLSLPTSWYRCVKVVF